MTLDADFQERRRMNQRRNKPRHALYELSMIFLYLVVSLIFFSASIGVASGAEALVTSVASGVEGVLVSSVFAG